LKRKYRW